MLYHRRNQISANHDRTARPSVALHKPLILVATCSLMGSERARWVLMHTAPSPPEAAFGPLHDRFHDVLDFDLTA